MRQPILPCIVCNKKMNYLWPEEELTNVDDGVDFYMTGCYGSKFDLQEFTAILCDTCLETAYNKGHVRFVKEYDILF